MWATHSHPALGDRACWKGAVAASTDLAICLVMKDLAHNNAPHSSVRLPQSSELAQPEPWELKPLDKTIANRAQTPTEGRCDQLSCQKALLLLPCVLCEDKPVIRPRPTQKELRAHCESRRGLGGLFSGLVSSRRVAKLPGATSAPSRAILAEDNSPCLTKDKALAARFSTSIAWSLLHLLIDDWWAEKPTQSPNWNCCTHWLHLGFSVPETSKSKKKLA